MSQIFQNITKLIFIKCVEGICCQSGHTVQKLYSLTKSIHYSNENKTFCCVNCIELTIPIKEKTINETT